MGWGGIIAGALGAAGGAISDIGRREQEQQQKMDLMRVQADIEKEKLQYADQLSKDRALWETDTSPEGYATKKTTADTAREKSILSTRNEAALDLARNQIPIAVEQEQKVGAAKAENVGREAGARAAAETAENLKRFNDPNYIKGLSAVARAQHIESSATLAQAALAKLQLENAKDTQQLQKALVVARQIEDPVARDTAVANVQQQITDRAYTGKDTAKAYSAWTSAQVKLGELETKLTTAMPEDKTRIQREIDETRAVSDQAARDLGVKVPTSKSGTPANAPPLSSFQKDGSKSSKNAPTAAASSASTPQASEPADSPSAKWKARQAELKQKQADWEAGQAEAAQRAFSSTNLQDPASAQALQDSPVFSYLTPQQKTQVQKAVLGR